jgi:hypothetical protein
MGLPEQVTDWSNAHAWVREMRDRRYKNKYKVREYQVMFKGECARRFKRRKEAEEFVSGINNLIKET